MATKLLMRMIVVVVVMIVKVMVVMMMMMMMASREGGGCDYLVTATPSSAGNLSLSGAFTTLLPRCLDCTIPLVCLWDVFLRVYYTAG